jgi:putative serine protease PepD
MNACTRRARARRTASLFSQILTATLVSSAALAGCAQAVDHGAAVAAQPISPNPAPLPPIPATAPDLQNAYEAVVGRVLPSVVQITTDTGLGSGVVFDKQGDIVTNDHVVGDSQRFQVRVSSSATPLSASLVGRYSPDDLAVIRLDKLPPVLVPATFGNSAQLRIGAIVLAVGNPLGLSGSVTEGIISATGRTVTEPAGPDSPGATLPEVLQTSAAINPGNSGGALVNLAGQVVGVPTLAGIDQQTGGGAAPGIGFAIPANIVTDIANQIVREGHVTDSHRAALGIGAITVIDPTGQPLGAAVASESADGPAAKAGIELGSIITSIGEQPLHSDTELTKILAGMKPGQQTPLALTGPDGSQRTVTVTLGQLPGS